MKSERPKTTRPPTGKQETVEGVRAQRAKHHAWEQDAKGRAATYRALANELDPESTPAYNEFRDALVRAVELHEDTPIIETACETALSMGLVQ